MHYAIMLTLRVLIIKSATVSTKYLLQNRKIRTSLAYESISFSDTRGCFQGGVIISSLLWSLVVDELLRRLDFNGFEVQGYVGIAILIRAQIQKHNVAFTAGRNKNKLTVSTFEK